MKGCPYDNAVAEATFKIIKSEFVKGMIFDFKPMAGSLLWQLIYYKKATKNENKKRAVPKTELSYRYLSFF